MGIGDALDRAVTYLRDPHLVRRIQERFGVKQILVSPDDESECNPGGGDSGVSCNNTSDVSSTTSTNGNGFISGSVEWLASKAKVQQRLKRPSVTPPPADSPSVSQISKSTPKVTEIIVESIPFFDIYFRLATELGYEPFYITFLPFVFWNVDTLLARHVVLLWCVSMYIGQASKALFKWSRPASPPAFRLEQNPILETEYGFPSTHAIVSTTFPFYFLYSCFGRYVVSLLLSIFCHDEYAVITVFTMCGAHKAQYSM